MHETDLCRLGETVGTALRDCGQRLVVAESCTGGWIAKVLTDVSGSSEWFERGLVTYSDRAKVELLGVDEHLLEAHGAVSEEVARAMAEGVLERSQGEIAVAVTGIAGPDGGSADKPVGLVWFAWALRSGFLISRPEHFDGDREAVRRQSVQVALRGVLRHLHYADN